VKSDQKKQYAGAFAVIGGFLINLVLYSNETRYGALVVMIGICGIAITFNQLCIVNGTISLRSLFTKENAIALVIYICLGVVAVLILMGDSGFQTIKNCS
jgi:hypothetical protein